MGKVSIIENTNLDKGSGIIGLSSKNKADLENLENGVYATDDPSLILILCVLHGHKPISTGYLDGFHNTHFVFKKTDLLNTNVEDYQRIAQDDCDNHLNLFLYVVACLGKSEKASFSKLMDDFSSFNKGVNN